MAIAEIRMILGIDGPIGPRESQESISLWATDSFGSSGSNLSVAVRANEEMAELLAKLRDRDDDPEAAIEAADVIIVLMRLFSRFEVDFNDVIDAKMQLNRKRKWRRTETGHGYHE